MIEKSETFMFKEADRKASRKRHHLRVRKKISGTPERPELSVYRNEKNIYIQIIDDINSVTLVSALSLDRAFDTKVGRSKEAAKMVSELIAKKALEKGISEIVLDRGGHVYHGRVQTLAKAAGGAGLRF